MGLSLTSWALTGTAPKCLAQLSTTAPAQGCAVTLLLKNSGPSMPGDAVVMAYFRAARNQTEWAARRSSTDARGNTLLTPLRQLFNFTRVKNLAAGASASVEFLVAASDLAEVDEQSGDRMSEPGSYELQFDDGAGQVVTMAAVVQGGRAVLDRFPSQGGQ